MRVFYAFLIATSLPVSAFAETCLQEKAIYQDADKSLTIAFKPVGELSFTASNAFNITMQNDIVLDGMVIWNNGYAMPNGVIQHKCPTGDVTGQELAACLIWEGVVYTIDGAGKVDLLPPEGDAAATQILLPDFGRAVHYSAIWDETKITLAPWDAMVLSGCQE